MIRKTKAKTKNKPKINLKRRNPYLVEYGYHFTNSKNVDSIMKNGLVPGFKNDDYYENLYDCVKKIADRIYNKKSPIYFSDIPSERNLPETLKQHFRSNNYDTCLKVNVSSLNQTPDIFMLIIDYGFTCFNDGLFYYLVADSRLNVKNNKSLKYQLDKYNYELPFYTLKENGDQELQSELIMLYGHLI